MSRVGRLTLVLPAPRLPAQVEPHDAEQTAAPRGGPWGRLAAPVFPADNRAIAIALSALTGFDFQDGTRSPGVLTAAQARDVAAWYATRRIT